MMPIWDIRFSGRIVVRAETKEDAEKLAEDLLDDVLDHPESIVTTYPPELLEHEGAEDAVEALFKYQG